MRKITQNFFTLLKICAARDLRITQVFSNIFDAVRADDKDPFYLENEELIEYMKKMLNLDSPKKEDDTPEGVKGFGGPAI